MSDGSRGPHAIQCALDLRAQLLAERGQDIDRHDVATEIRRHCHHTPFKSMRLAHGWRRVEDAVDAVCQWQIEQGLRATGLDIRSWQNWEAGGRPGPHNLDLLSRFFASDAVSLGFAPTYRQLDEQPLQQEREQECARPLTPEQAVAVCAEESQRYGARIDTPVGSYTMDELKAALATLAGDYPHTPVLPTLMQAKELRLRAWTLREQCQRPAQIHDLHRIAGWLSVVMANASFDLGGMTAGHTHLRVADLHAELVGDVTLRAWSRSLHALIAYWDGRPQLGWVEEVDTAVRKAEELREAHVQDEFSGILTFPEAKSWFWTASAHIGLGMRERAAQAESAAMNALELYEGDPATRRRTGEMSLARLDLATARLLRGEHDGIATELRPVFSAMEDRRIEIVVRRMLQLTAILDQPSCRAVQPLRDVRDELHDYIDYSRQSLPQTEVNA